MWFHLIVGALAATVLFLLYNHIKKKGVSVTWWGWLLAVLWVLYGVFVLEVIYAFIIERMLQGAVLMGLITGVVAVIWGLLLALFVFGKKTRSEI